MRFYWEWLGATYRQPVSRTNDSGLPRCHFALIGLRRCPGYQPRVVPPTRSLYLHQPIPAHLTCQHLGAEPTEHGFLAACTHPLGLAATWWEQILGHQH
jgi:hypothetical protein